MRLMHTVLSDNSSLQLSVMSSSPVWLITGTSTGFGRELTLALLAKRHKVIATARRLTSIDDLKAAGAATLALDVTSPPQLLETIAQEAISIYGHIDYLVNNAGYVLQGTIEESSPQEIYDQFNTNLFGLLNVTKAFLPHFRARRSGMVVLISSKGGWISYPGIPFYHATKFALEAIGEGLAFEVAHLGIKVLIIEPGNFRTSVLAKGSNLMTASHKIKDYAPVREGSNAIVSALNGNQTGDTKLGVLRIIDVITGTGMAAGKPSPLRVALGSDAVEDIEKKCKDELQNLYLWRNLSVSTDLEYFAADDS